MNYLKLTREKLSVEAISDLVAHDSCGAISLFAGTTRDNFADKKVTKLTKMVESIMKHTHTRN